MIATAITSSGRAAGRRPVVIPSPASTAEALAAETLGERVRALRLARGLSQSELGGDRLTKGFISHVESGRSRLSPESLRFLADRLGVPVAALQPDSPAAGNRAALLRAAEAAVLAGQADRAEALLDELGGLISGSEALADHHRLRGLVHLLRGEPDAAGDCGLAAITALPAGDASEAAVLAHNLIGRAHYEAERFAAALHYLDRGAELGARGFASPATLAGLHRNRGNCHMRLGDPLRALAAYSQAHDAATDAEDLEQLAIAEMGLGVAARERGDALAGIAHAERAVALLERLEMRQLQVHLLHNIGHANFDRGDLGQARAYQERAITAARAIGDRRIEGYAQERMAVIELAEGNVEAGARAAHEASVVAREIHDPVLRPAATMAEAEAAEAAGDGAGADRLMAQAQRWLQRSGAIEQRQVLLRIGAVLARRGDHEGASRVYEKAARLGMFS